MKAIILAGGEGSRLRPLTCDLPKPMVPIMNIPVMEHIINLLKLHGIKDIGVTLLYMPQKIKDYFGNGSKFGVNLQYFIEDSPLGTAGSVKNAQVFLDETFVVISGDSLTNIDLTKAIEYHRLKMSSATLVLTKVDVPLEYGIVITDNCGAVIDFVEKPSWGQVLSDTVNTGIYILEPHVLDYFKKNVKFDFSKDLFPLILRNQDSIYGYVSLDYWCDIGDFQSYMQAHFDIFEGKLDIEIKGANKKNNIWIGKGTVIEPNAQINGPCVIGENCIIGNGTIIENMSILGSNNIIEDEVSIKRSILWNNSCIEYGSEIRGAILCNKVHFKPYVSIFENAIVGDNCVVNERAIIKPKIKIWPQKSVDSLAIVDRNMVWGSKYFKSIFGERGLSGIINIDITPEFATRLGASYGSILGKGSKAVVSSNTSNSARMFKHAFISGLLSVGIEVYNMSSLLTPIARHSISFLSVNGGIHIRTSNENSDKLVVDFMDSKGCIISRSMERTIENAFQKEDFKRCSASEISRLNNITDYNNFYSRSILNEVNTQKIRMHNLKICIISPSEFVISLLMPILTNLGCKAISFISEDITISNTITDRLTANSADFAAFIDANGENLMLTDSSGRIVGEELYLAFISLILFKIKPKNNVVVPLTAPSVIEVLAKKFGGTVTRTKTSDNEIMREMLNIDTYKNNESKVQFQFNFDSIAALIKIIEYFCVFGTSFSETLHKIPDFYISKKSIFCPWELKGKVMKVLISDEKTTKLEILEGLKFIINNKGWVVVLPDADLPILRIYSESTSFTDADNLSQVYIDKIKLIIENI